MPETPGAGWPRMARPRLTGADGASTASPGKRGRGHARKRLWDTRAVLAGACGAEAAHTGHRAPARRRGGQAGGATGQGHSVPRGCPDRCFPPTATNNAPATRLTGPVGVTAPGGAPGRFRQYERAGRRRLAAAAPPRALQRPRRQPQLPGTAPAPRGRNEPGPLSCPSDTGAVSG